MRIIGIRCSNRVSNDSNIDELNEHFAKINTFDFSANIYSDMQIVRIENPLSFHFVDCFEAQTGFSSIKSNAVCADDVTPIFLKFVLSKLLTFLHTLSALVLHSRYVESESRSR